MRHKPRSPKEIAQAKPPKKTYSFSLEREPVERLVRLANQNKLPVSELVDEAIKAYLSAIGE